MKNLIQYSPAFVAVGCKLDYNTILEELDIVEFPSDKHLKKVVKEATKDIELFENTATFEDAIGLFGLADFIDGEINPLPETARANLLVSANLTKENKFIKQNLARLKVNKSWHISEVANECSFFGEICTNREQHKSETRGRKSTKEPDEYHVQTSKGIGREQLVTPSVESLYNHIPIEKLISNSQRPPTASIMQKLEEMDHDKLMELVVKVQGILQEKENK